MKSVFKHKCICISNPNHHSEAKKVISLVNSIAQKLQTTASPLEQIVPFLKSSSKW